MWNSGDKVRFISQRDAKKALIVVKTYTVYDRPEYGNYATELTEVAPVDGSDHFTVESTRLELADMTTIKDREVKPKDWMCAGIDEWEERVHREMTMSKYRDDCIVLKWLLPNGIVYEGVADLQRSSLSHQRLQWYTNIARFTPTSSSGGNLKKRNLLKSPETFFYLDKVVGRFIRCVSQSEWNRMQKERKKIKRVQQEEDFMEEEIAQVRKIYGIKYVS